MPSERRPPHRFIDEIPAGPSAIEPVGTGVPAFVGIAPRGPIDEARHVASWADFETLYGGLHAGSALGYTVSHYFSNGGGEAYILRLSTSEPATDPDGFLQAALPATRDGGLYLLDRIDHFTLLVAPDWSTCLSGRMAAFCHTTAFLVADAENVDPGEIEPIPGPHAASAAIYYPCCSRLTRWPAPHARFPPSGAVAASMRAPMRAAASGSPGGDERHGPRGHRLTEDVDRRGGRPAQPAWRQFAASDPPDPAPSSGARGHAPVPTRLRRSGSMSRAEAGAQHRGIARAWARLGRVRAERRVAVGAKMRAMVSGFLDGLYRAGAFQGASRATPASSNVTGNTMTQADLDRDVASSSWFRAAQASRVRDRPHRAAHRQLSRQACFDGVAAKTRPRDRSLAPYRYLIRWMAGRWPVSTRCRRATLSRAPPRRR